MPDFGAYQNEIYLAGLSGRLPPFPMRFDELEAKAHAAMPASLRLVCRRWLRRRAYARGQRRRVRQVGPLASDVRRRQAARPVDRALRHAAAVAFLHEPDRRDRALLPGRPRRSGDRPRRGADRRADGRLDAVGRSARGGRRRVRDAGILPALHPNRSRAGREPRGPGRSGPASRRSSSRSTPGCPAGARAISRPPTFRSCAVIAWPTIFPTRASRN